MSSSVPANPTEIRLQLFHNGYIPVPITAPDYQHEKVGSPGKQPFLAGWQNLPTTINEQIINLWPSTAKNHPGTGIICGTLVGVDLDIPLPDIAAQAGRIADAMLGATPLLRVGKAPKMLRCYRLESPLKKAMTPALFLEDGTKLQVEFLADGQQFVAFGTHPETGKPYEWLAASPLEVEASMVPIVTENTLTMFRAAVESVLRQAGGRTEKEWKQAREPAPASQIAAPRQKSSASNGKFFREVNRQALGNIEPWFCGLFPRARKEDGTGAWRVSSQDLGRQLEEDISFHPTEGGRDFGTEESVSAIDLVIEHGGAATAQDAAFWICDKLNITPAACGWTEKRARRGETPTPPAGDAPPIRVMAGELHLAADAAEKAVIDAGLPIFQRGDKLVRPISREVPASHGRTTLAAAFGALTKHSLTDVLSQCARWEKYDARAEDFVRINPPLNVSEILLSRYGQWSLPQVAGVITTPTLRPDGSVLAEPGYDPATRLYHVADPSVTLHPAVYKPTRQAAEGALKAMEALLEEFPFTGAVAKAVALSALITPVVRGALRVVPLHLFRANTPGSGKSYLADISSSISSGRPCPVITAAPDEAETEKRIGGLLLAGFPIVSLDNVNGELGGDLLCQAVERPLVRIRKLGGSDITEVESAATILATGNNARVRGDMVRRTLVADLDAKEERPELRQFKADPFATISADRGRYVSAALVIVRAYSAAGCPNPPKVLASFAEWSTLVRGALVWLGCADPVESMEAAREDDPELGELREMLSAWEQAAGYEAISVRELAALTDAKLPTVMGEPTDYAHPDLRELLHRLFGERGTINTLRISKWLSARAGRVVGADRFSKAAIVAHGGAARWKVERLKEREW